jgi:phage repressor protein C with HTH and peptisase S24 domain
MRIQPTPEQIEDAQRLKGKYLEWKQRRTDAGERVSQETLTEILGFNQSAVSQYLNGRIPLNVDAATKFATVLGCSVQDFSPSLAKQVARYTQATEVDPLPYLTNAGRVVVGRDEETVPVKLMTISIEGGYPAFLPDQEFDDGGTINIPLHEVEKADWIPHCLRAIKVRGDSMRPAFNDKDVVVIDIANTRMVSGEIYAINHDGKPVIKQLVKEGPTWWMYSFNRAPEYGRTIFRSPESAIIGMVVYQPPRKISGRMN